MTRLVLMVLAVTGMSHGADTSDVRNLLEARLKGQLKILRGLPSDTRISYDSTMHATHALQAADWHVAQMRVDKIETKGDTLILVGKRTNAGDQTQSFGTSKRIEIDISGPFAGDGASASKAIESGVFITDVNDLSKTLPGPWLALFGGMLRPNAKGKHVLEYRPEIARNADSQDTGVIAKTISGENVFAVGNDVMAPKPIYSPDPEYTEVARKAHAQGVVILAVIISKNGIPAEIYFIRPVGFGFDKGAFDAVRTWKFHPAMKDGVPVACVVNVEVSFQLN